MRDQSRQTGLMFLEQRTSGVNRLDYRRAGSAGSACCIDELQAAVAHAPSVLHLTGITPPCRSRRQPQCSGLPSPALPQALSSPRGALRVAGRGDWEGLPRRDELDLIGHHPETALR